MPIQAIVRTRTVAGHFLRVVAARFTVVTLFLDIFTTGRVRLGRHDAAIGKQRHTQCVGQLNPFIRIDVNREVPLTNGGHIQPSKQRKVTNHH